MNKCQRILSLVVLCILLILLERANATASQCRGPQSTKTSSKRRAVTVLSTEESTTEQKLDSTSTSTTIPSALKTATSSTSYPISAEARYFVNKAPATYNITGPLNSKLSKRSEHFIGKDDKTKCVACRLDCMQKVDPNIGSFFDSCLDQYYYYGCQKKQPCYDLHGGNFVVEMAIGICLEKNGCIMRSEFIKSNSDEDED